MPDAALYDALWVSRGTHRFVSEQPHLWSMIANCAQILCRTHGGERGKIEETHLAAG